VKRLLILISVLLATCGAGHAGENVDAAVSKRRAQELWELAIAAKGGRERLHSVSNILVSYQGKGRIVQLFVFPDKYWYWADDRPAIQSVNSEMSNLATGQSYLAQSVYGGKPGEQTLSKAENSGPDLRRAQLMYLLETAWLKPDPERYEDSTLDGRPVDVIFLRAGDQKVSFALDKKTHLPLAFTSYSWMKEVKYPNGRGIPAGEVSMTYEMLDYASIDGIMLPRRITLYSDSKSVSWWMQEYKINVDYSPKVFERPPSIEDGPDGWKK
jgi:hypothetical protein